MARASRFGTLTLGVLLAACGEGSTEPSATSSGTVQGRVESSSSVQGDGFAVAGIREGAANASRVVVAAVQAGGALDSLAGAAVSTDGSYRVEGVPAGIDRLVVIARSSSGAEVGRTIVHQGARADATVTAGPVDAASTLQAHVYQDMVRSGVPRSSINTVELALSLRTGDAATVAALVASASEIRTLATAAAARQDAVAAVLSAAGTALDASQRFAAMLPAAEAFASERHAGAPATQAETRLDSAAAARLRARGVSSPTQSQAAAAAGTALVRAGQVANASARAGLARAALRGDLQARQRALGEALGGGVLPTSAADAARQSLARALSILDTATTTATARQVVQQASDSATAAFQRSVAASGRVPQTLMTALQTALQNLPTQATLESRLSSATSGQAIGQAYATFGSDVRTAVQAAVSQLGANSGVDGRATADMFTSLRGTANTP